MQRRALLGLMLASSSLLVLGACSTIQNALSGSTTEIQVTLENAQAETKVILTALETAGQAAISAGLVSGGAANTVTGLLSNLSTAVAAFGNLSSGQTYADLAQSVISTATSLLALLPIDPGTKTAISLGLSLISALINGIVSLTVPAASTSTGSGAAVGARMMLAAPIPIPVPTLVVK